MNPRIALLLAALCFPAGLMAAQETASANYPQRPIRILVPQAPGGTADTVARAVAPGLSGVLGQQLVIDNRGGAGGAIGTELAARAAPDGYTLCLNGAGPMSILPYIQKQVPYDPVKDFVPISLITISPFALVTHPSVAARTVKDLIALAKAEPGKLNYASAGSGSVIYIGMELFKVMAGLDILHVAYKGSAQGLTDVLGGHVALMLFAVPPVLPHVKTDRLRLLAVTGARRSPMVPEVPTMSESGMPGYEITTWTAMFVPQKTPTPIASRVREAVIKVTRAPDTRSQFERQGVESVGSNAEELAAFLRADLAKNEKIIKLAGAAANY